MIDLFAVGLLAWATGICVALAAYGYARKAGHLGPDGENVWVAFCIGWPLVLLLLVIVSIGLAAYQIGALMATYNEPRS